MQVGERTQRLLDHLGVPAYITNRRWDVVASNRGARLLLGCAACPLGTRNVLWSVLVDPTGRGLFEDWEGVAQSVLAEFRHVAASHLGDPAFIELIDALTEASPEFRAWWPRYDVVGLHTGRKVFNHPTVGRLVLEHQPLTLPDARDLKLTAYVPLDEDDAPARLARLLALPDPDDEG